MTWFASNKKRGHLRIPDSPLGGEDESFIESSQAIEVHHFQRKLDVLVYTTPLLSLAVAAHLVVVMMRDVRPHVHGSETWVDMEGPWRNIGTEWTTLGDVYSCFSALQERLGQA